MRLNQLKRELALPEYETISRWAVGVSANPDTNTLQVLAGDSGADQVGLLDGNAAYDARIVCFQISSQKHAKARGCC